MVHEPVDLMFDSWYPTDYLSANIRHTVSALFSHPAKGKYMAFPLFNEFYPRFDEFFFSIPETIIFI